LFQNNRFQITTVWSLNVAVDISQFGFIQLLAAESANIGYDLSTSKRPDLILTEINLPGMNGPQTR